MSDLTDFFPAAGGGSLVSYDPLTLNRVNVYPPYLFSKYAYNAVYNSQNTGFYTSITSTTYGQTGAALALATSSSVFQTIVDITNTGKGGKLVCVLGPAVGQNITVTFKITIDGTATEIEYTNIYNLAMRGCLGGILAGKPVVSGSNYDQISSPYNGAYNHARSTTTSSNSNGFANTGSNINFFSLPTVFDGINQIQFKDTCKVEVKANVSTTSNMANTASVIIVPN